MKESISIHWFRQDLRLADNPALVNAAKHSKILPIYILDIKNAGKYDLGSASKWWLYYSLESLKKSLDGNLSIYCGDPIKIFENLSELFDIESIYWNRCYEPWQIKRDAKIKDFLKKKNIIATSSNGTLLWEPWTINKNDGTPYKVFTPFYRKGCLNAPAPREPLKPPKLNNLMYDNKSSITSIEDLNLLPEIKWDTQLEPHWNIGEKGASKQFNKFIKLGLNNYKEGRNFPEQPCVSRLSPHLHFGEISPNQLWYAVRSIGDDNNIDHFCSELGWREFSYCQLYHNQNLPTKNLQTKFDNFPWVNSKKLLKAWQKGQTGIPFVDAGMRELWQTGYIHNRVRMVVGSFLVKNLLLHWNHGERWFWDTLVDADLANNSASWQWVAGCGADAAPYFRIFNPVTQGQKFDPDGSYVRKYIPQIAKLPNKYLFSPWEAPEDVLKAAGVKLGSNYPKPIVDLKQSRQAALDAFAELKN